MQKVVTGDRVFVKDVDLGIGTVIGVAYRNESPWLYVKVKFGDGSVEWNGTSDQLERAE